MFRSLKKRVQSIGNSVHGRSGSRHGADQNKNKDNDNEKFNTPARQYTVPSHSVNINSEASSSRTVSTVASGDTSIGNGGSTPAGKQPPLPPSSSKRKSSRKDNKKRDVVDIPLEELNVVSKIEQLASFDVCVQAADALAASSGQQLSSSMSNQQTLPTGTDEEQMETTTDEVSPSEVLMSEHRLDKATGLPCTSVLVSPEGYMLLIPPDVDNTISSSEVSNNDAPLKETSVANITGRDSDKIETTDNSGKEDDDVASLDNQYEVEEEDTTATFANLRLQARDDYQSAVYVGHDLHPTGDKALNNFSAKGWSIPATSLALEQTEQSLNALAHFFEQMILSRKESAARTAIACDNLRRAATTIQQGKASTLELSGSWVIIDPRSNDFEMAPHRTGPLLSSGSTLATALAAFEEYYVQESEVEANRWRKASLQRDQILPKIHEAADRLHERSSNRQHALQESSRRVQVLEERMRALQELAEKKWKEVYEAEEKVTMRQRQLMEERRQQREKARLEKLRQDESSRVLETAAVNKGDAALGATSKEIWDMVSSVVADPGSFEPMDLPTAPLSAPRDKSFDSNSFDDSLAITSIPSSSESTSSAGNNITSSNVADVSIVTMPILSREEIAVEVGLPQLHAAALQADQQVQDTANCLLNVLSTLDTTRRSARIAAETCLLSAANTQAASIETWIQLEKQSLQERLVKLNTLEDNIKGSFDVRSDLDKYITTDRKERGGSSHLGDDDDGGVASALAVLSSHVDGLERDDSSYGINLSSQKNICDDEKVVNLEAAVDKVFDQKLSVDRSNHDQFESTVEQICSIAKEKSRAQRSRICYALNTKRSTDAEILSEVQFNALCEIFNAILTGCNDEIETGGVSNAKMCMMLAQTFYIDRPHVMNHAGASRDSRVYIKSRLIDHPIWSKDDFWDITLTQQISESLTHSGVMSNFDRKKRFSQQSEYEKARKARWYDLNQTERIEISSQVHAVVSAQLGALAHSMLELGCGLDRACAFVRRMSIRNQLPSSHRTMLLMHLMERNDTDLQV